MRGERTVLVVEDEEAHAELVRRGFAPHADRFDVQFVASVREARDQLGSRAFDLVITDLQLPDGRGMDLAAEVTVPIVVMTSHGSEQTAVEAIKAGAIDYIVKSPESFADLPRIGDRALREWDALRERERAEGELEKTRARLDEAQRVAHIGSWEIEIATGRVWLSEEARRLFGTSEGEPWADPGVLVERVMAEDRAELVARAREAMEPAGRAFEVTVRIVRDGSARIHRVTGQATDLGGPSTRLVGTIQDVTERSRLEEELRHVQKMDAIGTLAGGIAHDFNNLLMGVRGCLEIALEKIDAADSSRRYLEAALGAATSGAAITRQLLTFSRRREIDTTDVDIDAVVKGAREMLQRLLGEDVRLELHLDAHGEHVRADRGHLEQILMNLATNARDAMPDGGRLSIETRLETVDRRRSGPAALTPDTYVVLVVRDDGIGMDEQTRARAFEPFFTTKPQGKGTGLGLATIYGIIRQAGGHVEVETAPGRGTTFLIWLPRARTSLAQTTPRPAPAPVETRGAETILLVEDEPLVRVTVRHYLERAGWTVVEAVDGEEALRTFADHARIDVVLTDIVLPRGSGPQVARAIRSSAPHVRVVFMSAHPLDRLVEGGRLDEGRPLLQKPFTEQALIEAVGMVAPKRNGSGAPRPAPGRRRTILLVEDHALSRMAFRELLEDEGWDVIEAATGPEAVTASRTADRPIDVVIADLGLPGVSGAEVASQVRARFPSVGVVFVSGRDESDPELRAALASPRTTFVAKPIELDAVARAAAAMCE